MKKITTLLFILLITMIGCTNKKEIAKTVTEIRTHEKKYFGEMEYLGQTEQNVLNETGINTYLSNTNNLSDDFTILDCRSELGYDIMFQDSICLGTITYHSLKKLDKTIKAFNFLFEKDGKLKWKDEFDNYYTIDTDVSGNYFEIYTVDSTTKCNFMVYKIIK